MWRVTRNRFSEHYSVQIDRDTDTGQVVGERWRDEDELLHRDTFPALINYSRGTGFAEYSAWYQFGQVHRGGDLPAMVHRDPKTGNVVQEIWKLEDQTHRAGNLPARVIYDAETGTVLTQEYWWFGKKLTKQHTRQVSPT